MFQFAQSEKDTLEGLGVTVLVLFGSRATGTAGPMSDYDFGILLNLDGLRHYKEDRGGMFNAVYDIVCAKVGGDLGHDIDVVFLHEAPLELRQHTARFGQLLFEQRSGMFVDFASQTNMLYADFEPIRKVQQKILLDRIAYAAN